MASIKDRKITFSEDSFNPLRSPLKRYPNECPQCHKGIEVEPYNQLVNIVNDTNEYKITSDNLPTIEIVFRCPSCYRLFIAIYGKTYPDHPEFVLFDTLPWIPLP